MMSRTVGWCLSVLLLLAGFAAPLQAAENVESRLQQLLKAGAAGELPTTERFDWTELSALYERADWQLLWSYPDGEAREGMQRALGEWIGRSLQHGLDPADYQYGRLQQPFAETTAMSPEPVLNDLLMSQSFMWLARDLAGVRPSAREHDRLWHFPPRTLDVIELVLHTSVSGHVDEALESLLPSAAEYRRLSEHYTALLQAHEAEVWPVPDLNMKGLLRPGEQHPVVPRLRAALIHRGLLAVTGEADTEPQPGSVYTPRLVAAVQEFQREQGLEADGILGPETRAALQRTPEQTLQQLRANLQRWRWLPRDLGERYLLVRTGAYAMTLVEQEQAVQQYRVISGRPHRPTLSFGSDLDHVILNPPWTVPFRLAVEDLLPRQRRDGDYFASHQIEVLEQVEGRWQVVDSSSINWDELSRRHFPYLLRQRPGPLNSLGRIRFGMSNPYSIYLHDTPQQTLFESSERAFSSGCIRVDGIEELAQRLLGERRLAPVLATLETRHLRLERPLPVYLVYLTVWVDEQNQAHYHPDVYGLDGVLQQALGPVPKWLQDAVVPAGLAQK